MLYYFLISAKRVGDKFLLKENLKRIRSNRLKNAGRAKLTCRYFLLP